MSQSPLEEQRRQFQPKIPHHLQDLNNLKAEFGQETTSVGDQEEIQKLFPHTFGARIASFVKKNTSSSPLRVGVVLSGGQAPGGHNVICGLFDAIKELHPESQLFGFLNGPAGIVKSEFCELTEKSLAPYRNQGGFDRIGSGRTKIETKEQFELAEQTVRELKLDGLVVIGGDDSNTNAALLAEYFRTKECKTAVVGVPKTIDGDLKNAWIEISFGCDTACKVYSELIGNLARDGISAKKYYYFVKLMGRSASHVTLECAHQTHPNLTWISEEVEQEQRLFSDLVNELTDLVVARAKVGKNYGVVLIPEGVIEFIPEFQRLIQELNGLMESEEPTKRLSQESRTCFNALPQEIQKQLLLDRDPHGNVQVSKIETEKLFSQAVALELKKRGEAVAFSPQHHFFGYEGRAAFPSNFDAEYCYALGRVASLLVRERLTGYMACVQNLVQPVEEWKGTGIPITQMMNLETRHGKEKPVIQKALVDLTGEHFKQFAERRESWKIEDAYRYPGPVQYFGPDEVANVRTEFLKLKVKKEASCCT